MVPERDPDSTDGDGNHARNTPVTSYEETLGTLVHEFAHILGLPDLYDPPLDEFTPPESYGLGHYDLMSYGLYGMKTHDDLITPSKSSWNYPGLLSAWSRTYLEWVQPIAVHADTVFQIHRAQDPLPLAFPQIVKVWSSASFSALTPWAPREYFLLEHRQNGGSGTYDGGFNYDNEGAVLIYHIDENIIFPGESLTPINYPNDDPTLKGVDLEEADGLDDLDNKANFGDFLLYPGSEQGDFYRQLQDDFYRDSDSLDNSGQPTGVHIINGFGPLSDHDLADYLMTVDMKNFYFQVPNGIGYTGTDRAGPFVITGGTFDDGDDDSWIMAGQGISLKLRIRHAGMPNTARGVRAVIDSPDLSSVTASSVFYGDLPAMASSWGESTFIFSMAEPAGAFSWMPVTVTIADTNNNLSSDLIYLPVAAPPNLPPIVLVLTGPEPVGKGNSAAFTWIGDDPDGNVDGYYIGLDSIGDPSVWSTFTSITYTDLPYGDHTFSITAVDDDGASSDVQIWPFSLKKSSGGGGPCFVATALWGSEHRKTERLRDVRDRFLLKNMPGKAFVKLYYRHSPVPAEWVKRHPAISNALSALLSTLFWPFFM